MIPPEFFSYFNIDNKPELIKKFVFDPLIESYKSLKNMHGVKDSEENKITRELYIFIKNYSSISKAIQKHIIILIYRPKEVKGDTETEPDLQFVLPFHFKIIFEAKRIYKADSYSQYCGENGLGRFLSGYYSSEDIDGGMIAYVQRGDMLDVKEKIIGMVQQLDCINLKRDIGVDFAFLSVHKRVSNDDIKIYHIFFDLN